jgi:hypothetical protein
MGVTLGAYAAVLRVLGLSGDLDAVAAVDSLGHVRSKWPTASV